MEVHCRDVNISSLPGCVDGALTVVVVVDEAVVTVVFGEPPIHTTKYQLIQSLILISVLELCKSCEINRQVRLDIHVLETPSGRCRNNLESKRNEHTLFIKGRYFVYMYFVSQSKLSQPIRSTVLCNIIGF